jgi:uncharacterized protein YbjT (DUF2867 family)
MILVVGGTGRLGNQIVRALRDDGHDVRALVRKGSEYFWLNDTGTNYFFGDLRDSQSLHRALRDCDTVISSASVRLESTDNNHKTLADGHVALWEAAKARGVSRAIFVSCAGVANGGDIAVFSSKRASEDALAASGIPWTVFRPGLFAANFADLLRRSEHNGSVFLPGRPDARVAPMHGPDVAAIIAAALSPEYRDVGLDEVIDLAGPDMQTVEAAWKTACEVAGVKADFWKMAPSSLKLVAAAVRPIVRRWANHFESLGVHFGTDQSADGSASAARFGVALTPYRDAIASAWADRHPGEDPVAREEKVVHRQFVATIYEPGTVKFDALPEGPPPRQD